jgi:hypothetical protein
MAISRDELQMMMIWMMPLPYHLGMRVPLPCPLFKYVTPDPSSKPQLLLQNTWGHKALVWGNLTWGKGFRIRSLHVNQGPSQHFYCSFHSFPFPSCRPDSLSEHPVIRSSGKSDSPPSTSALRTPPGQLSSKIRKGHLANVPLLPSKAFPKWLLWSACASFHCVGNCCFCDKRIPPSVLRLQWLISFLGFSSRMELIHDDCDFDNTLALLKCHILHCLKFHHFTHAIVALFYSY